jgi:hypothetical protein
MVARKGDCLDFHQRFQALPQTVNKECRGPAMANQTATIQAIYRYPVKGLSPEKLECTSLAVGKTIPCDRLYAIENGPSGFDPAKPAYLPKQRFLMLMRNARLAELRTAFDETAHCLTIHAEGREAARGDLRTPEVRAAIERFFADFCAPELRGPPKLLHAADHSFSDVARKVVSIINLASVAALEAAAGAPVNPLRFRGNLHVEGWPAWREFDLLDGMLAIGDARLKVVKRIVRCAAVNVDPDTAQRDLAIPLALQRRLGHADCGIYAEVIEGGIIADDDTIAAVQPKLL